LAQKSSKTFLKEPSRAPASRAVRLLGVAVLISSALLPLLPLLTKYVPACAALERAASIWFDLHCQRDPARTLSLLGVPLAVCARCSGIYFGLGAGAALRWPRLTPRSLRLWVLGAAALMLLDVVLEARGLHGPWAAWRVLTGVLLAYPVGAGLAETVLGAPAKAPAQSP
jgi:uncharacterized membrane protein